MYKREAFLSLSLFAVCLAMPYVSFPAKYYFLGFFHSPFSLVRAIDYARF